MILGIGTDIIRVNRFQSWQKYSKKQLLRVFTQTELNYCCNDKNSYNLEQLASRFAAKEAFFKAFSATLVNLNLIQKTFSFLFGCQNIEIVKGVWDVPQLKINLQAFEKKIEKKLPKLKIHLSISHEKSYVISYVVISKYDGS